MDFNELIRQSRREIAMAEHISTITFPVTGGMKVYMNILNHVDRGILSAIRSYLFYMKSKKDIRMIPSSDDLTRELFFEMYMEKLDISFLDKKQVDEIQFVIKANKKSQAEIQRGMDYIFVLPGFNTVKINKEQVGKYLNIAKDFISRVEGGMI